MELEREREFSSSKSSFSNNSFDQLEDIREHHHVCSNTIHIDRSIERESSEKTLWRCRRRQEGSLLVVGKERRRGKRKKQPSKRRFLLLQNSFWTTTTVMKEGTKNRLKKKSVDRGYDDDEDGRVRRAVVADAEHGAAKTPTTNTDETATQKRAAK